jgi:hypothetical protein
MLVAVLLSLDGAGGYGKLGSGWNVAVALKVNLRCGSSRGTGSVSTECPVNSPHGVSQRTSGGSHPARLRQRAVNLTLIGVFSPDATGGPPLSACAEMCEVGSLTITKTKSIVTASSRRALSGLVSIMVHCIQTTSGSGNTKRFGTYRQSCWGDGPGSKLP